MHLVQNGNMFLTRGVLATQVFFVLVVALHSAMVVYGMLNWHAPPILILVALLVQWNSQIPHGKDSKLKL